MQHHALRKFLCLMVVGSIPFLSSCRTLATDVPVLGLHGPSIDNTGAIYSNEFRVFAADFAPFAGQLDRCLKEINRIAKDYEDDDQLRLQVAGNPECVKLEQQRGAANAKVQEINTELKPFGAWRQHPYKSPYGEFDSDVVEATVHADDAENLVSIYESLVWLYGVRTRQFKVHPLRVKSTEDYIETLRSSLSDSIRSAISTR